jgi:hypothetical protein
MCLFEKEERRASCSRRQTGTVSLMDPSRSTSLPRSSLQPHPGWAKLPWERLTFRTRGSSPQSVSESALSDGGSGGTRSLILWQSSSALPSVANEPCKTSLKWCCHLPQPSGPCLGARACPQPPHSTAFEPRCPLSPSKPCGPSSSPICWHVFALDGM